MSTSPMMLLSKLLRDKGLINLQNNESKATRLYTQSLTKLKFLREKEQT